MGTFFPRGNRVFVEELRYLSVSVVEEPRGCRLISGVRVVLQCVVEGRRRSLRPSVCSSSPRLSGGHLPACLLAEMAERTALANGKSPVILESQSKRIVPECRLRGVSIVLASFCCNGILFGVINTYSVIYAELFDRLQRSRVEEASAKACKFQLKGFLAWFLNLIRINQR